MARSIIISAVAVLAVGGQAFGQPCPTGQWCQWTVAEGGNDHWYRFTEEPMGWADAEVAARVMGGILVVIDDATENEFVSSTFAVPATPVWIGLFQDHDDPGYVEPGGGWVWVNGASVDFTNWAAGEPNQFQGSPQDFAVMYDQDNVNGAGTWDDDQNSPLFFGVVERDTDPTIPAVGTFGMVIMVGLILTAGAYTINRRQRQGSVNLCSLVFLLKDVVSKRCSARGKGNAT